MLHHLTIHLLQQPIYSPVVLIHVNILVPFHPHNQFILIYFRHTFLIKYAKHQHTQRNSKRTSHQADTFVSKRPFNTSIIKALQPVILQYFLKVSSQPIMFPYRNTEEQKIKHRQQHDSRKIRYHQSGRDRKRLIHENSSCDATHKHQRNKHRNRGQR